MYLDFAKAFNLVDVSILLHKLKEIGIQGNLLSWIKEFLSNRFQRVRIGNYLSNQREITSGVPQGSVLGPLLFFIYIQDLGVDLDQTLVRILKFVDDSKIIRGVRNHEEVQQFQEDLEKIYSWADSNHMRWNQGKFQMLRMGPNSQLIQDTILYTQGNQKAIKTKESIKDLGIMVDTTLRYKDQIQKAIGKAN